MKPLLLMQGWLCETAIYVVVLVRALIQYRECHSMHVNFVSQPATSNHPYIFLEEILSKIFV